MKINIFLSEEEKANAMAALEEVLNDLSNGVLVDFRMTIRGEQHTFHSHSTNMSSRAKELQRGIIF